MKKITFVLLAFLATLTFSAQTKAIDLKKSSITWTGKKVTGEHSGTINFKDGALVFKNKKIVGGSFTADMTTLTNTDQSDGGKTKLETHLKSGDFFNTDEYKTAKLVFKTIGEKSPNVYTVTADMTVKGKTNPVKFELIVKGKMAATEFSVDRTKFGIQYGSGSFFDDLGDRTIYDEFDLKVQLYF
ncbi:lipid-binding protein [Flavobacterium noncentrifugens]|uniref:Polyisoprenoid-binding protein YceI n=1 Tax=Flavobacterium noncentrifugens TaxID=1128970 RepID=A0A1G8W5N9_9FLAO|nr:YceI family protein [Flavobacterium noncentrifugens]GEP50784.1 lipid-binding protein [Flavobacterium noncentrifugens]SDJ73599.1 Polyisoprenoid-binding protein YceI [Flavobacterium noncentrifugens]